VLRLIALALVVTACRDKPAPVPAPEAKRELTGAYKTGDNIGVAAPSGASHADWIGPAKQVPFTKPTRARNSQEDVLYGTWAAKVGDYATRSAFMADRVMFTLEGSGKDLVTKITDAIANDNRLATSCIWLELRPDFTGIRRECAVVNGEASALDQTDFQTGAKKDLGTALEWYIDDKTGRIVIHFAADMLVPALRDGKLRSLVFRTWVLQIGKKVGDNTFTVTESFPEHDYTLPTRYAYEIVPQRFLDQK
jgi:hypothetical protein